LPKVFDRFYQGHNGHAGLGLALVRQLAESMGGRVEVLSTPGEGSSFSVHLPSYHPGS
jgi:signal transduction histidine kinase